MELPFDSVVIDRGDKQELLSETQFLRLDLHERIRLVLDRRVKFTKLGNEIEQRVALKAMRLAALPTKD